MKDRPLIALVDLAVNGRATTLVRHKRRFCCAKVACANSSCTEQGSRLAFARHRTTDRAGRWLTAQFGKNGRKRLRDRCGAGVRLAHRQRCSPALRKALVEDEQRFGSVEALGLDEVFFVHDGPYQRLVFSTFIVDVGIGQLLDFSSSYRSVFTNTVPRAVQVSDPFHLIMLDNLNLDECRRRAQNEREGHRGRKVDPLYRARQLRTMTDERLDDYGREKLMGLSRG